MNRSDTFPPATGRFTLRRLRAGDLAEFQAYRHDPEVGRYQGWTPWNDDYARSFLEKMSLAYLFQPAAWFQIGIADGETDSLIGDIGICIGEGGVTADIGFTMGAESQGRGLGTEAVSAAISLIFKTTTVDEVTGTTDARNVSSIRLLDRVGMQKIRTVETEFRSAPCTEFVYSRSRKDDRPLPADG